MNFVIYGKPNCQYCMMAKELLQMRGQPFNYLTLDEDYSLDHLVSMVVERNEPAPRSFPQILVQKGEGSDFEYVGGFDQLRSFMAQRVE